MSTVDEGKLLYMDYLQRDTGRRQHSKVENCQLYQLLRAGDMRAVEEAEQVFGANRSHPLCADGLRSVKYQFVVSAALAGRAAVVAGLPAESAQKIGCRYVRQMDLLEQGDAVEALNGEMIGAFVRELNAQEKMRIYSRDVMRSMDYVYEHLHERLSVQKVANHVGMSRSYFSTLFKNETGQSISAYILSKRMEAARNMLRMSDIPYAQISSILAFSSQSHFIRVFKQQTGYTPREYRLRFSDRDGK